MTIEISLTTYIRMMEEDGGFCLNCEEETYGVEPDAREYECDYCGANKVYGIEELLLMDNLTIMENDEGE